MRAGPGGRGRRGTALDHPPVFAERVYSIADGLALAVADGSRWCHQFGELSGLVVWRPWLRPLARRDRHATLAMTGGINEIATLRSL